MLKNIKQSVYNKVREYTNPLNLLIPWLNAIFQKYMGNYFNEEIKKEQFTSMGLKKLTLKANSLNSQLPPTIPFVLEQGSISLLKLDLQKLTCLIEEVEITLNFKTLEQYKEFAQTYKKQQLTAEKLQKMKEEIIKAYKVRSEQSNNGNQNAWNIIRQFLQKITFTVNKLVIHIIQPVTKEKLSIAINQISMRVRKLQEEKDQMVSTMIVGGLSLHINEQQQLFDINNFEKDSCIFSLQQEYKNKYDQHVVIHLRTELKERLKFNSTLSIKLMQLSFNYQQFQSSLQLILSILNHNKLIQSQDKVIIESTRQVEEENSQNWCPKINYNYWDQVNLPNQNDDQESKSLSDEPTIEFNDELEDALERSQFNEEIDEGYNEMNISQFDGNQSILYQSNLGDLNQSTFKQSIFSVSVFKELINDEDDRLGLDDLDNAQLIFKLKVQKTRIKLSKQILQDKWNSNKLHKADYFEIEIDQISWLMTKELIPSTITIKQTVIEIPYIQINHYQYCKESYTEQYHIEQTDENELFQSIVDNHIVNSTQIHESNFFHSCYDLSQNDIMQKINAQKSEFLQQYNGKYFKQKTILQIYNGQKQEQELITKNDNIIIFQKNIIQQQSNGIQIKLDHLNNTQAITLNKVIITLDFEEILELKQIFTIQISNQQIKSAPNLNLITIHNLNLDIQIQETDYLDFYFLSQMIKKDPNSNSVLHQEQKISFLTLNIMDVQVQQHGSGMITFDQIFCYKKEFDRVKQQYYSEIIAEIGLSKNQTRPMLKLMINEIRVTIPLVEIFINLTYINYVKSLVTIFKNLQKRLKQTTVNQSEQLIFRFLVDELLIKINLEIQNNQLQTRFILHASKLAGEFQGEQKKKFTLYNCCLIDQNWNYKKQNYDIPIYGCPQENENYKEQAHQMLHFRHAKYQANQVLFYKQERFNREGFKSLIMNEMIQADTNMGFQYTAIKLRMSQYLNPDCLEAINGNTNLLSIVITDNKKFEIKLQHGIIQVDEQWLDTIQTLKELQQKWESTLILVKSESKKKEIPNFSLSLSNIWVNYLPTYRKSTLLKTYLLKKDAIKTLTAIQAEQLYYSWIRLLIRVNSATISSDLQGHVESAQLYVKSTSKDIKHSNLSFLNPILLVPPKFGLFQENRKFSDGFQIDKDEQGLLRLLCFQKLFKIKGVTFTGKTINISQIQGNLKKDSIIGILDIFQMTIEKINKLIPEQQNKNDSLIVNNEDLYNYKNQMNIFEDDDIELPPKERVKQEKQLEIILKSLEIKLTIGQHFPPEVFSDSNPVNLEQQQNNEEIYYLEHSNIVLLEEFPQVYDQQENSCIYIVLKDFKVLCCGPNQKLIDQFYLSLFDFSIVDKIQNSKFSLILGREPKQNEINFLDAYYRLDKITNASDIELKLAKIRVCISGAALEFFLDIMNSHEQLSPKLDFLSKLNIQNNRESIIEFCVQEGYQVTFERLSEIKKPVKIDYLNFERVYAFITFDGSGVRLDGKLKGIVRLASYDNLTVFLKRAQIQNLSFEKEADFIKFLFDQYVHLIKNDSNLIQNLIVSFKAFQNITNIVCGIQNIFITIYHQGVIAGLSSGSIPLVKALGDEIVYLAKKPIEMCSTMTEGIGLTVANAVFQPIERALDSISVLTRSDKIPKDFLKNNAQQYGGYKK